MCTDAPPTQPPYPPRKRPPAYLFALGHKNLPPTVTANGITYHYVKLFKHDFFAATGLYQRENSTDLAVLKVQRMRRFFIYPMHWLGRYVANHEVDIYLHLQGVRGIPAFLGRVGYTGFLHAFIPGTDLRPGLPLTQQFWKDLEQLLLDLQARDIAYVDTNKRENILYGDDGRPWLIDFQISFRCKHRLLTNYFSMRFLRRLIRADWYHYYKHKTRLSPHLCSPEDFERAKKRGFLHSIHRRFATPIRTLRRRYLSRYDLHDTK